jgi:hypothetical protein
MRATVICGAGDIRVETVRDPVIQQPTDALVRVVRAYIGELLPDVLGGRSSRAGYSTPPSTLTECPTGTGQWPTARR